MEFKFYSNSDILLIESNSKDSWSNLTQDMDNEEEFFGWNSLKIDEEGKTVPRKRKIPVELSEEQQSTKQVQLAKDPLSFDGKPDIVKKPQTGKGQYLLFSYFLN